MGVTIEQYRAQIGAHNNMSRLKKDSTLLEGINFCETMQLMLFQLVITFMIIILSAFLYFPTKRLTC